MTSRYRTAGLRLSALLVAIAVAGCGTGPTPSPAVPITPALTPTLTPSPTASPRFIQTGALTTGRSSHTATILADGRVLIAGGYAGSDVVASAELYDPARGVFTLTGSMAHAREGHTATLLPDGRVLIAGGEAGSAAGYGDLASAELYDPRTGTFSPTGSMAEARWGHTANRLPDGRVLIGGGSSGGRDLASAELYDPKTGKFSRTGSLIGARSGHTATSLPDGRVLIAGGYAGDDLATVLATAELYDPTTGAFTSTGSMAFRRSGHAATLLADGEVLFTGGSGNSLGSTLSELYDPATGKFRSTGSMTMPRVSHSATLLPDGRVLIAGGWSSALSLLARVESPDRVDVGRPGLSIPPPTATAELYDPVAGTFSPIDSMATRRSGHTATLLGDGRVLIVGGQFLVPGGSSPELFELNPAPGTSATPTAVSHFSRTGSMTTVRGGQTAALLSDGRVLLIGGDDMGTTSAELFDPKTGTFTATGSTTSGRQAYATSPLLDGRVLVVGGISTSGMTAPAELYDPTTGQFTATGSLITSRLSPTATLLSDGRVLILGGGEGPGGLASAELFDPKTGQFSSTGSRSTANMGYTATLLADGRVLVAGGCEGNAEYCAATAAAELYDPATGKFSRTGSMSTARAYHTATLLLDGRVLIAGGDVTSTELYSPTVGKFWPGGEMTAVQSSSTATRLRDGRVLVTGGYAGQHVVDSAQLYDPATDSFSSAGSMTTGRSGHTATLLADGRVLIAGGADGQSGSLASAELYQP
jgi:hypothetical protein